VILFYSRNYLFGLVIRITAVEVCDASKAETRAIAWPIIAFCNANRRAAEKLSFAEIRVLN